MSTHYYSLFYFKLLTSLETDIVSIMVSYTFIKWHSFHVLLCIWGSPCCQYCLLPTQKQDRGPPLMVKRQRERTYKGVAKRRELYKSHSRMCCWRWSPSIYLSLGVTWRTSELLRLTMIHSTNTQWDQKGSSLFNLYPTQMISSQPSPISGVKVKCGLGIWGQRQCWIWMAVTCSIIHSTSMARVVLTFQWSFQSLRWRLIFSVPEKGSMGKYQTS